MSDTFSLYNELLKTYLNTFFLLNIFNLLLVFLENKMLSIIIVIYFLSMVFGQEINLDYNESLCSRNQISCPPMEVKVTIMRDIFDILDINKDNETDFDEIFNSQLKPLNIKDSNAIINGKKYGERFYSLLKWIQKMDTNKDGKVTWVEFLSKHNEIFI
uniref:EF-hand domain-containing protein n=1 Tax=Strongyloides papillosus TaxID=174720 RepID=A0A0N5BGD2_STREA